MTSGAKTDTTSHRLPIGWTTERLGTIGAWYSGGTPRMSEPSYWNGDIPWVSPKDMKSLRLRGTQDYVTAAALGNGTRVAPAGALLVVVRGMILAHSAPVACAVRPLAFNQDIKALVPRSGVESEYVLQWLAANKSLLLAATTESTHGTKKLASADLFALGIPLPPLAEQRLIAAALGDVDQSAAALVHVIAKKRDVKQATMQRLLTGEQRLPGFDGEWASIQLRDVASVDPDNLPATTDPAYEFEYISLEDVTVGVLEGHSRQVLRTAPWSCA